MSPFCAAPGNGAAARLVRSRLALGARHWEPGWSLRAEAVHSWPAHRGRVRCLAAAPSEALLLTAGRGRGSSSGRDGSVVRVWNLDECTVQAQYTGAWWGRRSAFACGGAQMVYWVHPAYGVHATIQPLHHTHCYCHHTTPFATATPHPLLLPPHHTPCYCHHTTPVATATTPHPLLLPPHHTHCYCHHTTPIATATTPHRCYCYHYSYSDLII